MTADSTSSRARGKINHENRHLQHQRRTAPLNLLHGSRTRHPMSFASGAQGSWEFQARFVARHHVIWLGKIEHGHPRNHEPVEVRRALPGDPEDPRPVYRSDDQ
jgi:hypothetical protein